MFIISVFAGACGNTRSGSGLSLSAWDETIHHKIGMVRMALKVRTDNLGLIHVSHRVSLNTMSDRCSTGPCGALSFCSCELNQYDVKIVSIL